MELKRRFRTRIFEFLRKAPVSNLPAKVNKVNARGEIRLGFEFAILKFFLSKFIDSSKRFKLISPRLPFFEVREDLLIRADSIGESGWDE